MTGKNELVQVAFAAIVKVDEKNRIVYGRAVQEVPDRSGEIFDYDGSKGHFERWSSETMTASGGKSAGNIRGMHGNIAAGKVLPDGGLVFHDDERAIDVAAKIVDDQEWNKVLEGVYTGFSIGGSYEKKWKDPANEKLTRYTAIPVEISIVDRPAVPTATFFEFQKADGTIEKREFKKAGPPFPVDDKEKEKPKDGDERKDPKTGETQVYADGKWTAKSKKADEPAPIEVNGTDDEVGLFAKLLNDHKLTMADAIKVLTKHVTPTTAEPTAAELAPFVEFYAKVQKVDLVKADDAKKAELTALAKDTVVRAKAMQTAKVFADEKNRKYPIDTADQVKAAWLYINHEPTTKRYEADELKAIKGRIENAWKKLVDAAGPTAVSDEDAKKAIPIVTLRKGLSHCADFAYLLQALCNLQESVEYEAYAEDDGSDLGMRMMSSIQELGQIASAMILEEIAEEYADTPVAQGHPMLAMSIQAKDLVKRVDDFFEKAGKRHSVGDMKRVQTMHDTAKTLGARCSGVDAMAEADKVAKGLSELQKRIDDAVTKAVTPLQTALTESQEKIKKLEAQPMPSKVVLRAVPKGNDTPAPAAPASGEVEPVRKHDGTVDEVATAMKKAQLQGQPLIK